jgi:hypothetical protein
MTLEALSRGEYIRQIREGIGPELPCLCDVAPQNFSPAGEKRNKVSFYDDCSG